VAFEMTDFEDDDTQVYKKPWVGLTDEEIDNLWEMAQAWNTPKHFYILISAKLKEKNN
jgi:hypothetical protein